MQALQRGEHGVGCWLLLWWQRLAVGTIQHYSAAPSALSLVKQMGIGRMSWDKSLSLGSDRREYALLIEVGTVAATSIQGAFRTGASNLKDTL
jgi:hypothetical protein